MFFLLTLRRKNEVKTGSKLYEIQCSIRNKYVTKKKEKLLFFLEKIKTHYQILEKIKKQSLNSETLKIKTRWLRNSTSEI